MLRNVFLVYILNSLALTGQDISPHTDELQRDAVCPFLLLYFCYKDTQDNQQIRRPKVHCTIKDKQKLLL